MILLTILPKVCQNCRLFQPIEGITSEFLLDKITCKDKRVLQKEELIDYLSAHQPDVLLTMGAGDIDRLVTKIKERFNE